MRSLRIVYCLFALVLVFAAQRAKAQDNPAFEVGLKPYGSYHMGNIDNINLGNGSLDVDIPLISYPQRGGKLKLDFSLHYFSASSSKSEQCYQSNCIWIPSVNGGALTTIDRQSLNVGPPPICTLYNSGNGEEYCNFQILDSDGATHLYAPTNSTSTTYRSIDATGTLNGSIDTEGISHSNMTYAYPDSREDANGNQITYSIPAATWTDTMGRTISVPVESTNQSDFTGCTGPQPIAFVYLWTLPGVGSANGGNSASTYPLKFCYSTLPANWNGPTTVNELTSVVLPNGTAWTFAWIQSSNTNALFFDLSQITFPTGGTLSYTWTSSIPCPMHQVPYAETETVLTRTLNPDDGVTPASQWTYAYNSGVTTVTDPAGNASTHTFGVAGPPGTANSCYLYENQAKFYQGSSSGTLLKTVNTTYSYSIWSHDPLLIEEPAINVVPTEVDTIWANGQRSTVKHTYDTGFTVYYPFYNPTGTLITNDPTQTAIYGKELTKTEYDYGNGGLGPPLRTTTTSYLALNNSTYLNANLLNLPSSVQIKDGGGTQRAYTTYAYDETGSPAGAHGNLTSTHRWLNTTGTYLVSSSVYNSNGLVTSSTDPKGNPTTYYYSGSCYAGSAPVAVTNSLSQMTNYCYDFNTGLLTGTEDPNLQTTSYAYDDMLRTTSITHPDTGSTTFAYPSPNEVNISEKMDTSPRYKTAVLLVDGVGREIRRIVSNGESVPYDQVDTFYNFSSSGHFNFKSYPYQGNGFSTARVTSGAGDTTSFDALNRTTSVAHSDGSSVLTSYTGRATSVQDEGNGTQRVQRISQVDGLGRLASVCEVSGNLTVGITGSQSAAPCGQDIGGTGFLTTYAYDALDNLTSVTQGPLNARSFVYDSLSRLTSSTNPEAGTTTYTYDADGNVLTKKDARNTTITYGPYDGLNRLGGKAYSDSTPTATYSYDQASAMGIALTNTIGRKSSESTAGTNATGSVFSYDPRGRVINNSQCTPQNCSGTLFPIAYTYDLIGDMLTATNGAGVNFTSAYNSGGRLTTLTSSLSDANHPGTLFGYTNIAHYNAEGSLTTVTLGNNVSETRSYDARLRLASIADGSVYSVTIPSTGGYAPNSDILAANDNVNGNWNYAYDGFNRLCASNQGGQTSLLCTSTNNTGQKAFTYAYDRFGNRWQQNVTAGSGPAPSYGFDANNRITGSGVGYDLAGDTTYDGTTTYTYDAEGRVITAVNGVSGSSSYVYDAEGRRVRKTTVAGGTVDILYDLGGHETTQITSAGAWTRGEVYAGGRHLATYQSTAPMTWFVYSDWLGTERVRQPYPSGTNETCISLPFGDALNCIGGDPSPMHFTGKERDSESGLDNFGARYNSSQYGRFMTPDPTGGHREDPQTLNKYAYVRNNPVNFTDPTGLDLKEQCSQESDTCHKEHWYSRQRYVGTYNEDHHFNVTHFQTDENGNLAGHQASFSSSGVQIDGNRAQFIAGTPATRVNGAAGSAFDGMHFVANSNCGGTCDAGGSLFGTATQFQSLLRSGNLVGPNPGLDAIDPFHPNTVQYRGGNTDGPDAHLSYQNSEDPYQQDPFHIDSRYPYGSVGGFLEHTGGVIHTIWNSATGNQGPPLPQDIPSAGVPH